jgi:SAM-dependent methyltransferase
MRQVDRPERKRCATGRRITLRAAPGTALTSIIRSMREYDSIADWYQTDRCRTFGVSEALAVAALLPAHSRILDIGCGNGIPITKALVNAGHRVVGLDSSAGMLARFRANLPRTPMIRSDARFLPIADGCLDAAISWGMMFHLPPTGQAAVFASVSRALKPGAPFLFTGAEIERVGNPGTSGTMGGVTFHYYAVPGYRNLIEAHGLILENIHDDPGASTYYLTRKS